LPNSNGYRGNGVDVPYGCDITEVVRWLSWLLNEDTEAADVVALGREFGIGFKNIGYPFGIFGISSIIIIE